MRNKVTYKTSGVDIDKANSFVKGIQGMMKGTMTNAVLKRKGSFGALFSLDIKSIKTRSLFHQRMALEQNCWLPRSLISMIR